MTIDYHKLLAWRPDDVHHVYSKRDTMLYALGLGLGADPVDDQELRFVYDRNLETLPTFALVLGLPQSWWRETGQVDVTKVVHGEQSLRLHRVPPPEGEVIGSTRVTGIVDKGQGRGALLYTERRVTDAASGELIATLASTSFARADGGFGGPAGPVKPVHSLPQRPPDAAVDRTLSPRSALLYRLSGDYNPLHADPEFARSAGFPRPIAHGLLGFGVAGWAILQTACAGMPARLRMIDARFSAPFFPGETLRTEMWFDGPVISFRTLVVGREVTALNNGRAEIAPS